MKTWKDGELITEPDLNALEVLAQQNADELAAIRSIVDTRVYVDGAIDITENGQYDVKTIEFANVNVPDHHEEIELQAALIEEIKDELLGKL